MTSYLEQGLRGLFASFADEGIAPVAVIVRQNLPVGHEAKKKKQLTFGLTKKNE